MSLEIICVAFFWHEQDTAWLVCNPKPMVLYPELSVTSLQSHLEYLSKNWWPCNFDVLSNTWFWSISIAATRCIDLGGAPRSTLWRTGTLRNANGTKICIWIYMCQLWWTVINAQGYKPYLKNTTDSQDKYHSGTLSKEYHSLSVQRCFKHTCMHISKCMYMNI